MNKDSIASSRAAKRYGIMLIVSLVLALGPLIGAIWSMVGFMLQQREMRHTHLAGNSITEEPQLDPIPIMIGFIVFPVGLFLLTRATMWFSRHVREHRAGRSA